MHDSSPAETSAYERQLPIWPAVALFIGIVLGLFIPKTYQLFQATIAAAGPPAAPFVRSEWEYPGANSLQQSEGGSSEIKQSGRPTIVAHAPSLFSYSTTDTIEKVWNFYAKLTGIGGSAFQPGSTASTGSFNSTVNVTGAQANVGGVVYYTGDPNRSAVRSATIVNQRPGYTVTIFLSQGEKEPQTFINLVVEKKSSGS